MRELLLEDVGEEFPAHVEALAGVGEAREVPEGQGVREGVAEVEHEGGLQVRGVELQAGLVVRAKGGRGQEQGGRGEVLKRMLDRRTQQRLRGGGGGRQEQPRVGQAGGGRGGGG